MALAACGIKAHHSDPFVEAFAHASSIHTTANSCTAFRYYVALLSSLKFDRKSVRSVATISGSVFACHQEHSHVNVVDWVDRKTKIKCAMKRYERLLAARTNTLMVSTSVETSSSCKSKAQVDHNRTQSPPHVSRLSSVEITSNTFNSDTQPTASPPLCSKRSIAIGPACTDGLRVDLFHLYHSQ